MELVSKNLRPLWHGLTKKTFRCPQCSQKLRVPIKPGRTLRVNCVRCQSVTLIDFRIPLIEVFKWQSGKSLKQNLFDIHHRFWSLPLSARFSILLWIFLLALLLDGLMGYSNLAVKNSIDQNNREKSSEIIHKI